MAGLHGVPVMLMRYDTDEYPFRERVSEALNNNQLEELHRNIGTIALRTRKNDQLTEFHKSFYNFNTKFLETYKQFVGGVVERVMGEPVIYQATPTFRVHLPGNVAVGEFHKDTDYNHNANAVTFWVPVTDAYGTNTVWAEMDGKERELPVPMGHFMAFDSMNLRHGNMINETDHTRVSFDFRVIPQSQFEPSDAVSINTHMKMDIGGYYADSLPG